MKKKIFIFLMIGIVLIILGITLIENSEKYVKIEDKKIDVEIADTSAERQEGLMFRKNLCEGCGMLFVYEEEKTPGYWMKNTKIPLDIIFIDSDLKVVNLFHAETCENKKCQTYSPENKSLYVLETNINEFNESVIGKKVKIVY